MPENIIYQHVVLGPGTILTGPQDIQSVPVQPGELQTAITNAKQLLQAKKYDLSEDDRQQIVQLYNATVVDGRFIDELATNPKLVATRLGIELSDSAAAQLTQAGTDVAHHFGTISPYLPKRIIAIVVVVVLIVAGARVPEPRDVVIDSSGRVKL